MEQVKVTAVQTNDESFARALSISEERETQLDKIMDECHEKTSTYPDAIQAISETGITANELAYCAFHMGAFAESMRYKQKLLHKLLGE